MAREIINEIVVNDGDVDIFQITLNYGWSTENSDIPIANIDIVWYDEDYGAMKGKSFPLFWGDLCRLASGSKRAVKSHRDGDHLDDF